MDRLLVIDDDQSILNYLQTFFMQQSRFETKCLQDSSQAITVIDDFQPDLLLLDMDMPKVTGIEILKQLMDRESSPEAAVLSGVSDIELAVQAIKMGAHDYLTKPVDTERLMQLLDKMSEKRRIKAEANMVHGAHKNNPNPPTLEKIVTQAPEMQPVMEQVKDIAQNDDAVLIWGEPGTGKELVARAIHENSEQTKGEFVLCYAADLANYLLTPNKAPHHFTAIEQAQNGSLFVEDIGDLPLAQQIKVIRKFQEEELFPTSDNTNDETKKVRLIIATSANLQKEVERGNFRTDTFYRLNLHSLHIPSLKDRQGDIDFLAHYYIKKYSEIHNKSVSGISDDVLQLLNSYHFPGNVRELENIINSSVLLEKNSTLSRKSMPQYFLESTLRSNYYIADAHHKSMAEVEKEHIYRVLQHTGGNRTASSKILGISRVSLISKIKTYKLNI
jgi:DNA-binding NtrC family response regulator